MDVARQIVEACNDVEFQVFPRLFSHPIGDFYPSDVVAGNMMRARFKNQQPVAILEVANFGSAFQIIAKVALVMRQHDAEAGERNAVLDDFAYHAKCLAVGDDERGLWFGAFQIMRQLVFLKENCHSIIIENVAHGLHLRQYHASFGCRTVDGRHQQHYVVGSKQLAQHRLGFVSRFRYQPLQSFYHFRQGIGMQGAKVDNSIWLGSRNLFARYFR